MNSLDINSGRLRIQQGNAAHSLRNMQQKINNTVNRLWRTTNILMLFTKSGINNHTELVLISITASAKVMVPMKVEQACQATTEIRINLRCKRPRAQAMQPKTMLEGYRMESEAEVITADRITIHTPTPIQIFMDIPKEQIWAWEGSTDTALIMFGIEQIHVAIHACPAE